MNGIALRVVIALVLLAISSPAAAEHEGHAVYGPPYEPGDSQFRGICSTAFYGTATRLPSGCSVTHRADGVDLVAMIDSGAEGSRPRVDTTIYSPSHYGEVSGGVEVTVPVPAAATTARVVVTIDHSLETITSGMGSTSGMLFLEARGACRFNCSGRAVARLDKGEGRMTLEVTARAPEGDTVGPSVSVLLGGAAHAQLSHEYVASTVVDPPGPSGCYWFVRPCIPHDLHVYAAKRQGYARAAVQFSTQAIEVFSS